LGELFLLYNDLPRVFKGNGILIVMNLEVYAARFPLQGNNVDPERTAPIGALKIAKDHLAKTGLLARSISLSGVTGLERCFRLDLAKDECVTIEEYEVSFSATRAVVGLKQGITEVSQVEGRC